MTDMMLRRSSIRYSTTPAPVTPYQKAEQLWDERIGSARVQAKNWRLMALGVLLLTFVLAGGVLWLSTRSIVTPYVVEVDAQGSVRAVGPAMEAYHPTDAQIDYHLSRFLRDVRSIPIDPIVLRENWLEAYDYTTNRGAALLNEYARVKDPFASVGQTSVAVEVASVVRVSDSSFQLRWIERTYANGTLNATERWTAIVSILLQPPKDVARLRKNPLGIYVDSLDWSRELGADPHTGDTP
jgi:type IV secretion system protein TrbF